MHLCKRDGPQHIHFSSHPGEEALSGRYTLLKKGGLFLGSSCPPLDTLFIAFMFPVSFCSSRRSSKIPQVLVQNFSIKNSILHTYSTTYSTNIHWVFWGYTDMIVGLWLLLFPAKDLLIIYHLWPWMKNLLECSGLLIDQKKPFEDVISDIYTKKYSWKDSADNVQSTK